MIQQVKDFYKTKGWGYYDSKVEENVRARIRNSDFTIICPNCCGGVLYHRLGMRFDSPTINTWMYKTDFCLMCSDLPYYLSMPLKFYFNPIKPNVPCAKIGEGNKTIRIDFAHYKTEEEAEEKWNERKLRIHWDNLYIIACDGDGASVKDFELLEGVAKRKIIFTSRPHPEIRDSFELYTMHRFETANGMQLTRHPITGLRSWEREFDYTTWLNGGNELRLNSTLGYPHFPKGTK